MGARERGNKRVYPGPERASELLSFRSFWCGGYLWLAILLLLAPPANPSNADVAKLCACI